VQENKHEEKFMMMAGVQKKSPHVKRLMMIKVTW
jgi:hypothetical protein